MKLLTKEIERQLRANNELATGEEFVDAMTFKPVLKLFDPCGAATWLITELSVDGDTMFGLCDLGHGMPEVGYVSLAELAAFKHKYLNLGIERDMHFTPTKTLGEYAQIARLIGRLQA